jgi:hypothetical protein
MRSARRRRCNTKLLGVRGYRKLENEIHLPMRRGLLTAMVSEDCMSITRYALCAWPSGWDRGRRLYGRRTRRGSAHYNASRLRMGKCIIDINYLETKYMKQSMRNVVYCVSMFVMLGIQRPVDSGVRGREEPM